MEQDQITEAKKRSFVDITAQELKYKFRSKQDLTQYLSEHRECHYLVNLTPLLV